MWSEPWCRSQVQWGPAWQRYLQAQPPAAETPLCFRPHHWQKLRQKEREKGKRKLKKKYFRPIHVSLPFVIAILQFYYSKRPWHMAEVTVNLTLTSLWYGVNLNKIFNLSILRSYFTWFVTFDLQNLIRQIHQVRDWKKHQIQVTKTKLPYKHIHFKVECQVTKKSYLHVILNYIILIIHWL